MAPVLQTDVSSLIRIEGEVCSSEAVTVFTRTVAGDLLTSAGWPSAQIFSFALAEMAWNVARQVEIDPGQQRKESFTLYFAGLQPTIHQTRRLFRDPSSMSTNQLA
jgi:hypothetical protein